MENSEWFDDIPVIGALSNSEALARFSDLIAPQDTDSYLGASRNRRLSLFPKTPIWKCTTHIVGFIPVDSPRKSWVNVIDPTAISPDTTLNGQRIKITLDGLRIASYPGGGTHNILFDFYGQNQRGKETEHLHFNAAFRVHEGDHLPAKGCPIFVGLNVGDQGIVFKCYTVNIRNEEDEVFIRFLDSELFRSGLKLVSVAHPAVALLTQMSYNLTRNLATRGRNVPVQDIALGLDFSNVTTQMKLAQGTYVVVQLPAETLRTWSWAEWHYNRLTGIIGNKADPSLDLEYNYITFGITKI